MNINTRFVLLLCIFFLPCAVCAEGNKHAWNTETFHSAPFDIAIPVAWTGRPYGQSHLDSKGVCVFFAKYGYDMDEVWPVLRTCIKEKEKLLKKGVVFEKPPELVTVFYVFLQDNDLEKQPKLIFMHRVL